MGHVGEPPAVCDFADGSMSLVRVLKGVSAAVAFEQDVCEDPGDTLALFADGL